MELPVPEISKDEVLVKVKAAAICGTDIHLYEWNDWCENVNAKNPMVIDHEFCGEVVKVGSNVTKVKVGDLVAGETHIPCGKCMLCMTGNQHICKDMKILGVHIDGAFAEYIKIIVKQIISEIKRFDAHPFILPAMGSHGGANNIGQKELLASYGITEEEMKVPIISSMDTVVLGKVEGSIPIYFSKDAMKADGIIALNRVKTHTDFKSRITESGISKVLVIWISLLVKTM